MVSSTAYTNVDNILGAEETADQDDYSVEEIVQVLRTYAEEAENGRMGGDNPRDAIWTANWDRYWGRYYNSDKAAWQSQHVMPEASQFVDRWAAAMREALDRNSDWFTVLDATGEASQLNVLIAKVMKVLLSRCSRTVDGHVADFSSVFEDQMKMGAIMACCASVTWEDDLEAPDGWPRVNTVDPREVHYDPKGRNLYRRRIYELDHFELMQLARDYDEEFDEAIYDIDEILGLMAEEDEKLRNNAETASGSYQGDGGNEGRKPIKMEEFLATIIMPDGEVVASDSLCIIANDTWLIRGPEKNPFWHQRDWIVFCPMVSVPLSTYGRTYMEEWADVADAFIELTNLILDGVYTSTIKAFIANPELLDDPTQLDEGISPHKIFKTTEDLSDLRRFIAEIDLGSLPAEAINVWSALKNELREGAKLSEIALGQMAPNSRTTATEIQMSTQSGSSMIRSMARTIETRFVERVLTLVWKTALQYMDFTTIQDAIGPEVAQMLNERREEFLEASLTFQVRGISGIVDRQQKLQNILQALQVIGQNEFLAQELLTRMSPQKLVETLMSLFGLEMSQFAPSEQERAIAALEGQAGHAAEGVQNEGGRPARPQAQ